MASIDLSSVIDAFGALVSECPQRSPTVRGAEQAVTDALHTIERNAALLEWEANQQRQRATEAEQQTRDEAADLERRKQARADLAARAAAKAKKGTRS